MMFTGIVTEMGTVAAVEPINGAVRLTVTAQETSSGVAVGDSVAVNGVCLTAVAIVGDDFSVEIVNETLDRSSLGALALGAVVNLERPMLASGRFDGHIVQGHVDGVGILLSIHPEGEAARYRIALPRELAKYVVEKGSIAVDGASLTVTAVSNVSNLDAWFEIVLIPHTLDVTVLGRIEPQDIVNLEVDVIAKYLERMMGTIE
jgi:riboflavin synthase